MTQKKSEFLSSYAEFFPTKGEWAVEGTYFIKTKANKPQACLEDGSPQLRSLGMYWVGMAEGWEEKPPGPGKSRVSWLGHHPPQAQGVKNRKDLSWLLPTARNETVQSSCV